LNDLAGAPRVCVESAVQSDLQWGFEQGAVVFPWCPLARARLISKTADVLPRGTQRLQVLLEGCSQSEELPGAVGRVRLQRVGGGGTLRVCCRGA